MRALKIAALPLAMFLICAPAGAELGLHIEKAAFGAVNAKGGFSGAVCDATPKLGAACNSRETCQLPIDAHSLCSDAIAGTGKAMIVEWSCNGLPQQKLSFPEAAQAALTCPLEQPATGAPRQLGATH